MGFDFSTVPSIEGLTDVTGTARYLNSGVGLPGPEVPSRWGEVIDISMPKLPADFFRVGPRFYIARKLEMGPGYVQLPPHTHPGGELAFVVAGEYFDADTNGAPLRVYPEGAVVVYNQGSTHRPLSTSGANLRYITFDGLLEVKDAEAHLAKLQKIGVPENAVEYALLFLVQDPAERQRLQEEFFNKA